MMFVFSMFRIDDLHPSISVVWEDTFQSAGAGLWPFFVHHWLYVRSQCVKLPNNNLLPLFAAITYDTLLTNLIMRCVKENFRLTLFIYFIAQSIDMTVQLCPRHGLHAPAVCRIGHSTSARSCNFRLTQVNQCHQMAKAEAALGQPLHPGPSWEYSTVRLSASGRRYHRELLRGFRAAAVTKITHTEVCNVCVSSCT